jgi:hypothetical protein
LVVIDRKRDVELSDRADAVIMGIGSDPYAVNLSAREKTLAPTLLEKMVPDASKPEGHRGSLAPWDVRSILLIVLSSV